MLKTIKTTKQLRLDELIKYVWENSISDKEFKSETNPHVIVYVTQDNNVLDNGYSIGENDLFPVEIEEEITEETVFDRLVELYRDAHDEQYRTVNYFNENINYVKDDDTVFIYALIDNKLELIWERE